MANPEHLEILKQGVRVWNQWREENPTDAIDLTEANLFEADLSKVNLRGADLSKAYLLGADLCGANLRGARLQGALLNLADLRDADLSGANLRGANFHIADLRRANLRRADLYHSRLSAANLSGANLSGANLAEGQLVRTNLTKANLTACSIYGISAWDLTLDGTEQTDLVITLPDEPIITVDNLEVAQFVYLLLKNEKVRDVIDTITSKVVLILGRFTEERKAVLDAIRNELRKQNFAPIVFDFDKPASKDVTGTVETLARMARFIIADLTDPSSIPHELATVVPLLRTTPVLTLRLEGSSGFSMFEDLRAYPWVLPTHEYRDVEELLASLAEVLEPAETKVKELRGETDGES